MVGMLNKEWLVKDVGDDGEEKLNKVIFDQREIVEDYGGAGFVLHDWRFKDWWGRGENEYEGDY